jgi:hypothetical protein
LLEIVDDVAAPVQQLNQCVEFGAGHEAVLVGARNSAQRSPVCEPCETCETPTGSYRRANTAATEMTQRWTCIVATDRESAYRVVGDFT